jgi:hypothetical protein
MIWGLVPITRATRMDNPPRTRLKNMPFIRSPLKKLLKNGLSAHQVLKYIPGAFPLRLPLNGF